MGIEYVGIYSIANAIMLLGEVISKMGLETGIMRFVSRLDIQKEKNMIKSIIESSLKMVIIFSIVITFLIIIFSSTLTNMYNGTPLLKLAIILFALSIPFNSITVVSAFASQGFKLLKYKVFTTQFLNPSILLVSMIFCYLFISKVSAIVLPIVVSSIIGSIAMLILLRKISNIRIKNIIYSKFNKKLFVYSTPLMFVAVLQTLMHWMDILMLGFYLDTKIVGLYHPAARTAGLLQALLLSFISIYAPMVSELHKQNNISEISKIYKLVTRWLFSISIPIALLPWSASVNQFPKFDTFVGTKCR